MKPIHALVAITVGVCMHVAAANAQQAPGRAARGASDASTVSVSASILASGLVTSGAVRVLEESGQLAIASIAFTGQSAVLVLRSVSQAAEVSIQVGASVVRELGLAVGTVLVSSSEAVGYALYSGVKLVAYIPNEVGRAMLHQSRLN